MSNGNFPPSPQLPTQLPSPAFSPLPPPVPNDRHIRRGQDEYAIALSNLLPTGIAWPRWPDSTLMKVIYGLAGIMGWADGRAADLLERESYPPTTTEMIDWWERAWGLPETCLLHPPTALAERQKMLVLKMTLLGAQSREFFLGVANWLGYSITITEYRPFMVGVDACGDNRTRQADGTLSDWPCQIGSPEMRFAWTVHILSNKLVWFRAGSGQAGIDPHLFIQRATDLECLFHRWAPAHTLPLFDYSAIDDPLAGTLVGFYVVLRDGQQVQQRNTDQVIDDRPDVVYWPQAPNTYDLGSPKFAQPTLLVALAPPDPATTNWINAVVARGGTVSTARRQQIDFLIKGLKIDGVWPQLDHLGIRAAESEPQALTDLVTTTYGANYNCSFSPNHGYSPGATQGYINSNFNPSAANGKFTRNSAFAAVWVQSPGAIQPNDYVFGDVTNQWSNYINVNDSGSGVTSMGVNEGTPHWSLTFSDDQSWGFYLVNRSGVINTVGYKNGVQQQFSSTPSMALVNSPFLFGGAYSYWSTNQISVTCLGGALTDAQQAALYMRLRQYLIGIGSPPNTPPLP